MIDNLRLQKLKTMAILALLAGVTAVPQIPDLFGDTLVIVLIWCIGGVWLTQMISSGAVKTKMFMVNRVLLLALVAALVGFAKSPHLFESLQAFLKFTALLIFGLVILNYEDQKQLFMVILKTVIMTSIIMSLLAIYEYYFGLWGMPANGRVQVLFPNPNHLAGFLALAMTFALSVVLEPAPKNWFRWLTWLSLAVGMIALYLTGSKGGILSLLAGFSILIYAKRKTLFYTFIAGILIVFAVIWLTPLKSAVFSREIKDPFTFEKKDLYIETFKYLGDHPFLGTGLETFKYYYPQYKSMPELRSAPYVHNELLNIWSDLGLLGVAAFVWLLVLFYCQARHLIKEDKQLYLNAFLAGVTGIVAHSMFEFNLHDPALALLFTGMVFTVLGLSREQKSKNVSLAVKNPQLVLTCSWSLIICASLVMLLPVYAQNQSEQGAAALKNQNSVQALLHYQEAMKYNPISAEIKAGAAKAFYVQGMILNDEIFLWAAKHYFEKAAKLEPLDPFRWRDLAMFHARVGQWPEARAAYDHVLRLAPRVKALSSEYDSLQKSIENKDAK
ncbi:MAG: O-antigen ligase family protein [bacterium]|nr:O-antigen ligase family protein [bacterium]